jgi:hypothetical protein
MQNHLKDMLFALVDGQVEFIIGGGVAAVLHGVERVTMDLDIAIELSPENIKRFKAAAEKLGLKPRIPVAIETLSDAGTVNRMIKDKGALVYSLTDPNNPLRHLDLFIRDELTYAAMKPHAVTMGVDGRKLSVVSATKLLALKESIQPPRAKDVLDIAELRVLARRSDA